MEDSSTITQPQKCAAFVLRSARTLRLSNMTTTSELSMNPHDTLNPIEIDWFAKGDTVRVTPRNAQRFEIQKDKVIQILQREKESERFRKQFSHLLTRSENG